MLTTFDLNEYVYEALRAGASGFLLKDVPADQLVAGIHVVAEGEALLAPSITRRLIEEFAHQAPVDRTPPKELSELTPRERELLVEIAAGKSNGAIAESLVLTKRAVEKHVNSIFSKLDLPESQDVSRRVKATLIFLAEEGADVR